MNWQGLNAEEEAEKCRTERRKNPSIIKQLSHVELEKNVQYSKCEQRGAKLHPEASTGHSSPFNRMEKKRCQDLSLPQRRKCVKYVHSQSTDAEHVSTVEPSIAPTKKVVSRRISNTQTPGTILPETRTRK